MKLRIAFWLALGLFECANAAEPALSPYHQVADTRAALLQQTDADALAAAAMLSPAIPNGGLAGTDLPAALELLHAAVAAAPRRADLAVLELAVCLGVRGCDVAQRQQHLEEVDSGNGFALLPNLLHAAASDPAGNAESALLALSKARHFNFHWNELSAHLVDAAVRTGHVDSSMALYDIDSGLLVASTPLMNFSPVYRDCQGRSLEHSQLSSACQRIAQSMMESDGSVVESLGVGLARIVYPSDSLEAKAAVEERRIRNYRSSLHKSDALMTASEADQELARRKEYPRQPDALLAELRQAGKDPSPPPGWTVDSPRPLPMANNSDIRGVIPPTPRSAATITTAQMSSPEQPNDARILVKTATYGANVSAGLTGNATGDVRTACDGQPVCSYQVLSSRLGDPAFGVQKDFSVQWSCGRDSSVYTAYAPKEAGFGSTVHLECVAGVNSLSAVVPPRSNTAVLPVQSAAALYGNWEGPSGNNFRISQGFYDAAGCALDYRVLSVHSVLQNSTLFLVIDLGLENSRALPPGPGQIRLCHEGNMWQEYRLKADAFDPSAVFAATIGSCFSETSFLEFKAAGGVGGKSRECSTGLAARELDASPSPGFDCGQAQTAVERRICGDRSLAALDAKLAVFYYAALGDALEDHQQLRNGQLQWIKERNSCADSKCLTNLYNSRIIALRDLLVSTH